MVEDVSRNLGMGVCAPAHVLVLGSSKDCGNVIVYVHAVVHVYIA